MNTLPLIRRRSLLAVAAALLAAAPWGVRADDDDDHEQAREALAQGLVLPLATVLAKLQEQGWPGQVLKVEFEHEHGHYVYEIRLLQSDGRVVKLDVDAQNAQVLKVKRKDRR